VVGEPAVLASCVSFARWDSTVWSGGVPGPMKAVVVPTTIPILDSGCKGAGWVVGPFDEQNDYFLFDHPGVSLTISSFQVSRSRGGRCACRQSGIFLCVEPSLLEHNGSHCDLLLLSTIPFPDSREAIKQKKYD
jgi:hypothetical protein